MTPTEEKIQKLERTLALPGLSADEKAIYQKALDKLKDEKFLKDHIIIAKMPPAEKGKKKKPKFYVGYEWKDGKSAFEVKEIEFDELTKRYNYNILNKTDKVTFWVHENLIAGKVSDKVKKLKAPATCPPVDSNGKNRIDKEGLELLQTCIDSEKQTADLHSKDGKYTPEREKLHEKLMAEFKNQKPCVKQQKPIAVLTGGPPGSGKTHFLKNFAPWLTSGNVYHIDADAVRAKLPEYKGWNADNTHVETSHIVKEMLNTIGKPCEYDLIYDGTMNKAKNYLPLIQHLKDLGYEVYVIYLQVPKKLSIERAMERYQRTGRYVPLKVIEEVYEKGLDAFEKVIKEADGYIRVNGETGKIVEQGGKEIPRDRNYETEKCATCDDKKNKTTVEKGKEKPLAQHKFTKDEREISEAGAKKEIERIIALAKNMGRTEILEAAQAFHKKYRSGYSQAHDKSTDAKQRLTPTAENLIRWMKNPGKFDLIGIDTFIKDDATADLKIKKEIFWHRLGIK